MDLQKLKWKKEFIDSQLNFGKEYIPGFSFAILLLDVRGIGETNLVILKRVSRIFRDDSLIYNCIFL